MSDCMKRPLVDPKAYEAAEYFLPNDADEQRKWALAAVIQNAVEDWLIHEARRADLKGK